MTTTTHYSLLYIEAEVIKKDSWFFEGVIGYDYIFTNPWHEDISTFRKDVPAEEYRTKIANWREGMGVEPADILVFAKDCMAILRAEAIGDEPGYYPSILAYDMEMIGVNDALENWYPDIFKLLWDKYENTQFGGSDPLIVRLILKVTYAYERGRSSWYGYYEDEGDITAIEVLDLSTSPETAQKRSLLDLR
jgi:hypothetical protein